MDANIRIAQPYSKTSAARLANTWHACKLIDQNAIEGDLVECGVWAGGNVMMMRWASPDRRVWLYDTFDGMTQPGRYDGNKAIDRWLTKRMNGRKWAAVAAHEVRDNLKEVGVYDHAKCQLIIGDVRITLKLQHCLPKQIAVLRLDLDFYDATRTAMEILFPRLSIGGVLIIDDYGYWPGAKKAVADYLGMDNKLKAVDEHGYWMVK